MNSIMEEAVKAKQSAEKLFAVKDFMGAKHYALKAQSICPQLEGVPQMVTTFEVLSTLQNRVNGEVDLYSVLGVNASAERSVLKKQFKKLVVLLHPDDNRTVGAAEAFKLVSDAWSVLSDRLKRYSYDVKRNSQFLAAGSQSVSKLDTFWTVCTSCRVQYEYLRKYVNKRLSCKNCRGIFVSVETGSAPVTYCPWSYAAENNNGNGYANFSYNVNSSVCFGGNGSSVFHSDHGPKYASGLSFQWSNSTSHKSNGRAKGYGKHGPGEVTGLSGVRLGRPPKNRKVEDVNGPGPDLVVPNGNVVNETLTRWYPPAPVIDVRKLLIDKARSVIRCKLEEMKLASKNGKAVKKQSPAPITVPDPDFHDFDTDRSEEVFKPKQIWAIYDEEDGMPRLYCLIREVISVSPFQVHISYLNSKTDTEFGSIKWIESGFTKSCGSFRVFHSETIDQVNIFSHLLGREKAGRGGCVKIYPKSGDVWAVYRNWSVNWNQKTPKEVIHQYEMVEIVDDYSEELGVCVTPLVKLEGYKTVYQRDLNGNGNGSRRIPRQEMFRFSHQVPSCLLRGQALNLPDGCWDLDPAATPEELLRAAIEDKPGAKMED
ncbi:uncharacterized protein LOC143602464 [Bidens hawaiensis]|uniref:uncharacterized protein LOC143602464 n=1 Tax=Bidens hawaiensis TaxID=980011 RepID=UPI00404B9A4D